MKGESNEEILASLVREAESIDTGGYTDQEITEMIGFFEQGGLRFERKDVLEFMRAYIFREEQLSNQAIQRFLAQKLSQKGKHPEASENPCTGIVA